MAREQFELSKSHSDLLTRLMDMCELPTKKAVLENALVMFGWAVSEVQKGQAIASVNDKRKVYRELTMPVLETARHHRAVAEV
jgi:hypothetical protein